MPRKLSSGTPAPVAENPFEGWSTLTDAARKIGRDPSTVRVWTKRGWITSHIVGNSVIMVKIDEVREYSEKHPPIKTRSIDKRKKKS
jgi:hypothetical protein